MAFSSSLRNLARSGLRLPLIRTQFERTQLQSTQFVRTFWKISKGRMEKDWGDRLKHLFDREIKVANLVIVEDDNQPRDKCTIEVHPHALEMMRVSFCNYGFVVHVDLRCLEKSCEDKLKHFLDKEIKVVIVEDDNRPRDKCTIEVHPHTLKVMRVWHKQMKILALLSCLYSLAEFKLTLKESGVLAPLYYLYKHSPYYLYKHSLWDTLRMNGKVNGSADAITATETWLDRIGPLAKEISTVLIVHQKEKKTGSRPEDRLDLLPHDFGSILIKISQLRLKWQAIASLDSAPILHDSEMEYMDMTESIIKDVHKAVVVEQLFQKELDGHVKDYC